MALTLKKNDVVAVMTGKDKGKTGKILRVLPDRVIVEGVNLRKRREKARRSGTKGQVVEVPSPVHRSNVLLYCSACKKGVRFGQKISGKKKIRVCKKCGREL